MKLKDKDIAEVSSVLARYGAELGTDNEIVDPDGDLTGVKITKGQRGRFQARMARSGSLLSSGPGAEFVARFVEKFWDWGSETNTKV